MVAVGDAAQQIVEEVRRQFREIKGIMEGESEPDYERCVAISTDSAIKQMLLPGVIAVSVPVGMALLAVIGNGNIIGEFIAPISLVGVLLGSLVCAFMLAVMMANAGGAWDNAKKHIEAGNLGGKGSDAHKAAVVGDTVGDPFKDTSGPSLNILLKLLAIVSLGDCTSNWQRLPANLGLVLHSLFGRNPCAIAANCDATLPDVPVGLVRYWVMLSRFFYPIPRPLPQRAREGEQSWADFVIIC